MLDSIYLIGKNNSDKIIEELIKPLNLGKSKKEDILLIIIFNLDNGKVEFCPKELDGQVAKEYKWIGNTFSAAREPIARLTIDNIKYLYEDEKNNIIYNIRNKIKNIKENSGIYLQELDDILSDVEHIKLDKVKAEIEEYKNSKKDKYNIGLFTIGVKKNGKVIHLALENFYAEFIKWYIKYPDKPTEGSCHICGKSPDVFVDPAFESGSLLKIYNIDKKGFISGISNDYSQKGKTFALCPDCRLYLIIGNKYINNKLTFQIDGSINVYVIPKISFTEYKQEYIDRISDVISGITFYEGFENLNKIGLNIEELFAEWYSFTIIFGSKEQASFNLEYFIQEVPITNISIIYQSINEIKEEACKFWNNESKQWDLTLTGIARLYPLRKIGSEVEKGPLIELLASIFQLDQYSLNKLLETAVLLAKVHRYELYNLYKIQQNEKDRALAHNMVKFNYLILLLKRLGMITMTKVSENVSVDDERISKWIETMGYNTLQTGLFMLGYLISQIGNAQYQRDDTKKSILDKLDFKGMKKERILMLVNELPHHLRNYRILGYNEKYYYTTMESLNKSIDKLDNNPIENLFYILSGYAFGTYSAISGVKNE